MEARTEQLVGWHTCGAKQTGVCDANGRDDEAEIPDQEHAA